MATPEEKKKQYSAAEQHAIAAKHRFMNAGGGPQGPVAGGRSARRPGIAQAPQQQKVDLSSNEAIVAGVREQRAKRMAHEAAQQRARLANDRTLETMRGQNQIGLEKTRHGFTMEQQQDTQGFQQQTAETNRKQALADDARDKGFELIRTGVPENIKAGTELIRTQGQYGMHGFNLPDFSKVQQEPQQFSPKAPVKPDWQKLEDADGNQYLVEPESGKTYYPQGEPGQAMGTGKAKAVSTDGMSEAGYVGDVNDQEDRTRKERRAAYDRVGKERMDAIQAQVEALRQAGDAQAFGAVLETLSDDELEALKLVF